MSLGLFEICKPLKMGSFRNHGVEDELEEAERRGTLTQILEEAGYSKTKQKFAAPKFISMQRMSLPFPLTHAKA